MQISYIFYLMNLGQSTYFNPPTSLLKYFLSTFILLIVFFESIWRFKEDLKQRKDYIPIDVN